MIDLREEIAIYKRTLREYEAQEARLLEAGRIPNEAFYNCIRNLTIKIAMLEKIQEGV